MPNTAIHRVLIANRGEIALRIAATVQDLAMVPVCVAGEDDRDSAHWLRAASRQGLPGRGAAAYLDVPAMIAAAQAADCDAVHPGYGFLSENAGFAEAVEAAGLIFVGPTPTQLQMFGDKISARALAAAQRVPVLEGSAALPDVAALKVFLSALGEEGSAVIKAAAGGGGRGMQVLMPQVDKAAAFARCSAEALAAFGDGTLYAERFVPDARHVEVQILGDGRGNVVHLWERDCSLQRRHQKLIEIAPAPALDPGLRSSLLDAACRMAASVQYRGLGTFEFLVDARAGRYWFIEANPRLQVEHTITEEILGLDLVALQFGIARGETLGALGLANPPPAPNAIAIQIRINAETLNSDGSARPSGGVLQIFEPASGPGVRVDSGVYGGYASNPAFDSLLAKLIVRTPGLELARACERAAAAAAACRVEGIKTSLPLARAILTHPDVQAMNISTRFLEVHAGALLETTASLIAAHELPQAAPSAPRAEGAHEIPVGTVALRAPLRGSVVRLTVAPGAMVAQGETVAVIEAMKMHHHVEAPVAGILVAFTAATGETLAEDAPVCFIRAQEGEGAALDMGAALDPAAHRADLAEVEALHALGLDAQRPEAVARRRRNGQRTARENVAALCDPDSFMEYGALMVAAQRRRRSLDDLRRNTPADGLVAGIGTINASLFGAETTRCAVLAYDYTVLAGTQGAMNHKKKDRLFELAQEWSLPVVFFTEGGGGRPGDVDVDDIIG
ncbi:MAG: hypothetical protein RL434_1815, partial [Pseudomonadota bacterium]